MIFICVFLFPFSNEDFDFMSDIFMKDDTSNLYLEDDFHFEIILHQRDFIPGLSIQDNIADAITQSRRMFTILSRYFSLSLLCCLFC